MDEQRRTKSDETPEPGLGPEEAYRWRGVSDDAGDAEGHGWRGKYAIPDSDTPGPDEAMRGRPVGDDADDTEAHGFKGRFAIPDGDSNTKGSEPLFRSGRGGPADERLGRDSADYFRWGRATGGQDDAEGHAIRSKGHDDTEPDAVGPEGAYRWNRTSGDTEDAEGHALRGRGGVAVPQDAEGNEESQEAGPDESFRWGR